VTASNEHAKRATTALAKLLRPGADTAEAAAIIQEVLDAAAHERGKDAEASAQARTSRLLSVSPAVIYSFKARDDFAPTFVSDNLESLFGYSPAEYLDNPDFWQERVHADDLARVEMPRPTAS